MGNNSLIMYQLMNNASEMWNIWKTCICYSYNHVYIVQLILQDNENSNIMFKKNPMKPDLTVTQKKYF